MVSPHKAVPAAVMVPVLLLSGCGSGGKQQAGGGGAPQAQAKGGAASTQQQKPDKPSKPEKPTAVSLDIRIKNGEVTPAGQRVNVTMGQPISLSVTSDRADAIHVHSQPEHEFEVKPGKRQEFTFEIARPGVYEVEAHETGTVIFSLAVRP